MFLDFVLSKVNHKSKVVWHKQSTIAARLPCSVTTVERATRAAVEVGAVIVICSSDRQARAEGVGVRSHHRYHNFLRPCLDWPGYKPGADPGRAEGGNKGHHGGPTRSWKRCEEDERETHRLLASHPKGLQSPSRATASNPSRATAPE